MTSSQTIARCQTLRTRSHRQLLWHLASVALLALGVSTPFALAIANDVSLGSSLSATPLVLKDGRIARVSIHTIPFPDDAATLASTTAMELQTFTEAMATDCFLTAQVIGHVGKKETNGRDTVDIHRLARARADTIQQSLIANGLPEASIASVWDWQFMVQDARVTLWVFQLAAGDDCSDNTLSPAPSDQLVALENKTPAELPSPEKADRSHQPPEPVEQRVVAAAKPTVTRPLPTSVPEQKKADEKKDAGGEQVIKPAMAAAPKTPASETPAPVPLTAVATAKPEAAPEGRVVVSDDGKLEITFATNSSYFPKGWSTELGAFLDRLDQGKSYIVRVQTSVDGDVSVVGTSSEAEAAKYNQWLADRRFERVKAWLLKNSESSTLQIEPAEVSNDGSRRVTVEVNPLG